MTDMLIHDITVASIWFEIWGSWIRVLKLGIVGPESSTDGGT